MKVFCMSQTPTTGFVLAHEGLLACTPVAVSSVLKDVLRSRKEINILLSRAFSRRVPDSYLRDHCLSCTMPGRKTRSLVFLHTLREYGGASDSETISNIIFAIECSHAASVLVDDLLDSDEIRHGELSVQRRWSNSKTVLFAHYLSASALSAVHFDEVLADNLLQAYKTMTVGEMYDVLLPDGGWTEMGYSDLVAQKTFPLFEFSLFAAARLSILEAEETRKLRNVGRSLGRLYQLSNDYYDWQVSNLPKRHLPGSSWPITFSLPLATYLERYGVSSLRLDLNRRLLSYEEWEYLLHKIWTADVDHHCRMEIRQASDRVLSESLLLPKGLRQVLYGMVQLLNDGDFWYHNYERDEPVSVGP